MPRLKFGAWTPYTVDANNPRTPVDTSGADVIGFVSGAPAAYNDATADVPVSLPPYNPGDKVPARFILTFTPAPPENGETPEAWIAQPIPQGAAAVPAGLAPNTPVTVTVASMPPTGTVGGFQAVMEYAD